MKRTLALLFWGVFAASCNKDDNDGDLSSLNIRLSHSVDGQPLQFDSTIYTNAAGEQYSISRLQYYLSRFRCYKDGALVYTSDTVLFTDAAKEENSMTIPDVPPGDYDSLAFLIGVDPAHNMHGRLFPSAENIGMEWPDPMGGGYHFIKLEGHWKDNNLSPGFAVHIGTDPFAVACGVKRQIRLLAGEETQIKLDMNINEWFRGPYPYSFAADGGYTMGNAALMQKIADNGKDVFKAIP